MKKYINKIIFSLLIALFGLAIIPAAASAATVYVESSRNTISVGDTAIVTVKINADGAVLNTVEGDITLKSPTGNMTVNEFSLANSAFGLWPRTPSLSKDGHTISFVGGVPGGFSIEGATMFKFIVEATKEGIITITPQNISVFANDGKGTKLPVTFKDVSVTVGPKKSDVPAQNDWLSVVSGDTTKPSDFIVVAGQDPTLFDGKKFVFFSAVDNQSGIDHYDVSENGGPIVRSGSTYVLRDQTDAVKLSVIAYDKAGNTKSAVYPTADDIAWIPAGIIFALIVIVVAIFKMIKRNRKNAPRSL
jgi:hypothetical protein